MTRDIQELLESTTPRSREPFDIGDLVGKGLRRRRRRQVTTVAAGLLLVVAAVAGLVALQTTPEDLYIGPESDHIDPEPDHGIELLHVSTEVVELAAPIVGPDGPPLTDEPVGSISESPDASPPTMVRREFLLAYEFVVHNTSGEPIGREERGEGPTESGLSATIEPHDDLRELMGEQVIEDSEIYGVRVRLFDAQGSAIIGPDEQGFFIRRVLLGTYRPDLPDGGDAPTSERLAAIEEAALNATFIIWMDGERLASFDLTRHRD